MTSICAPCSKAVTDMAGSKRPQAMSKKTLGSLRRKKVRISKGYWYTHDKSCDLHLCILECLVLNPLVKEVRKLKVLHVSHCSSYAYFNVYMK